MKNSQTSDRITRSPIFPTSLHEDVANLVLDYFSRISDVDTVLVVNSCARGQAVADSDLDFAILVKPQTTARQVASIQKKWDKFSSQDGRIKEYKASSKFAHLHLDVINGEYTPTILEVGVASDYFEVEIGNQVCYSAPMGAAGGHFQELQRRWLPYYGEKLRLERFSMMKDGCQYDLDHIPQFVARHLHFQAFDILYKAFQEYLQVLFISRKVYPIAYNKWIKYQVETLLGDQELYQSLSPILSISNIESTEINRKSEMLQEMLNQVELF